MALPKRRHSRSRVYKGRTHLVLHGPALTQCPQCGAFKRTHRICPACGFYKGRKVLTIVEETKKEQLEKR